MLTSGYTSKNNVRKEDMPIQTAGFYTVRPGVCAVKVTGEVTVARNSGNFSVSGENVIGVKEGETLVGHVALIEYTYH